MLQGNVQSQELLQAIRSVEKHLPPSSILPPHIDEIFYVVCHPDPETQKPYVLWDDILTAFDGAIQVRHRAKIVPFLKGKDLRILEPRRIAVVPDTVLDVVVGSKEGLSLTGVSEVTALGLLQGDENTDREVAVSQENTINATSPIRRNPIYGLVERAMENYTHIVRLLAFHSTRGSHAAPDDQPQTINNLAVPTYAVNNGNSQLLGPQSATTNVPMQWDVVQMSISASHGDKDAQVAIGDMYRDGTGVPQDYQAAMDWYLKSADQGHAAGQERVGALYGEGFGVPQNYSTAMEWYLKSAEQEYAAAQDQIGELYDHGRGVPRDYGRAMEWYLKAASQGHTTSQYNIGVIYKYGRGVPLDYKQAMEWFLKAASQGHALSQHIIGWLYNNGEGVPQDYAQAMKWYLKAAQQGDGVAQNSIGTLYHNGEGVPQDYAQAMDWYLKAVRQGNRTAHFNIGQLYSAGQGVPQDYTKAAECFSKAAELGDDRAKEALEDLKRKGVSVN